MKQRPSLKARALQLLAQREHSRIELRRKLLRHAQADCRARAQADGPEPQDKPTADLDEALEDAGPCLDKLLDWLEAHDYLSQERFVESRVHARSRRFGNLRIRQELAQHGAVLDEAAQRSLRDTELERARAVWQRKFGEEGAHDPAERARQMRFLAGRGFSPDVIRRVVQVRDD